MAQVHKKRHSPNPYIDRVWHTKNTSDGVYLATPDGSWDLIVGIGTDGSRTMMLTGQATEPAYVPYTAGTSAVVISFAAGAYLPHIKGGALLNSTESLPVSGDNFRLAGHNFKLPTYQSAESLVEKMVQAGVLKNNSIVEASLSGKPKAASRRAVQRHFKDTTGVAQKTLQQIHQAQHAVQLLQQGKNPTQAAMDAGYTDQPHLTKSLKRIMHKKPSNVDDVHKI